MDAGNNKKYLKNQEELLQNVNHTLITHFTDKISHTIKCCRKENLKGDPFRLFIYCVLMPTPFLHKKQIEEIFVKNPELQILRQSIHIPHTWIKVSTVLYATTLTMAVIAIIGSPIHINAGYFILPALFLGVLSFFISAMTLDDFKLYQTFHELEEVARKTAVEHFSNGLAKERARNEIIASLPRILEQVVVQIHTLLLAEGISPQKAEQISSSLRQLRLEYLDDPFGQPFNPTTPEQAIEPSRYYDEESE